MTAGLALALHAIDTDDEQEWDFSWRDEEGKPGRGTIARELLTGRWSVSEDLGGGVHELALAHAVEHLLAVCQVYVTGPLGESDDYGAGSRWEDADEHRGHVAAACRLLWCVIGDALLRGWTPQEGE